MDGFPVNVTDLAILAVVLISGLFAFVRGFVHELLSIGAWIGAALVTLIALPMLLPFARQIISIQIAADIAAGVALFLIVLIALSIITHWLARRVRESSLGPLDRSLGLVFGLARGALIVCIAWIALLWAMPPRDHPDWITEARARPLVEQGADLLVSMLPEGLMPRLPDDQQTGEREGAASFDALVRPGVAGGSSGEASRSTSGDDPGEANEAESSAPSGYKNQDRKDLQRLIDASQ